MANTGALSAGSATTAAESPWSDDDWRNPSNIFGAGVADIVSPTFDAGDQSYVLKAYNFNTAAIGTADTINGVVCVINARYAAGTAASIDLVQALGTTLAKTGTNLASTPTPVTSSLANYTFGGTANTWGNSLTSAWVKNGNFGVAIGMIANDANTDVEIDSVTLTIYYTSPAILTAADGSFSLTGNDAATKTGRKITAEAGSYALTGNAVTFTLGKSMTASGGSYALTGNAATLKRCYCITAEAGSYTEAGQDAVPKAGRKTTAEAGAYTYTGIDATLTKTTGTAGIVLSASSYITASGEDTTAQLTPPSGKSVSDFQAGRIADDENPLDSIDLASGKYTEIEWSIKATAAAGSSTYEFRVTANGTALNTYSVTPTLTIANLNNYSMTADAGAYTLTGFAAGLFAGHYVTAEAGAYTLSGQDASLEWYHILTADAGAYTYAGEAANLLFGRVLGGSAGAYIYTGHDASLIRDAHFDTSIGTYTLTGQDAGMTYRVLHNPTAWRVYPERDEIDVDAVANVSVSDDTITVSRSSIKVKRSAIETDLYRRK